MPLQLPNPLLSGFNPDPSIVQVDGAYYLVTSSFEYLPGLPVYRSVDLAHWTLIGHVATRPEQVCVEKVTTNAGVYAPTIRYHEGRFFVIVSVMQSPVGCVLFTATDPDLAWDDDGVAIVTYSTYQSQGSANRQVTEIRQARVDLESGEMLEPSRRLWSGRLKHPEAPHLYRIGNWWYLLIAEGGTERGHCISLARAKAPDGPFEPHPANPLLSASGTARPIQNTGHADLLQTLDGQWAMVLLGMRPVGAMQSFSPLGRETFITPVIWEQEWPIPQAVELHLRDGVNEEYFDFREARGLDDPGWLGVRALPAAIARPGSDGLWIEGDGTGLDSPQPRFIGRRQRHLYACVEARVDASRGVGGLGARFAETHWFSLEARSAGGVTTVTATARLSGLVQSFTAQLPPGEVDLRMDMRPPSAGQPGSSGGDSIHISARAGGQSVDLADLDGRYWSAETCASFTGRVFGLYASEGTVCFLRMRYRGSEQPFPAGDEAAP